jgi:hypothetical protein
VCNIYRGIECVNCNSRAECVNVYRGAECVNCYSGAECVNCYSGAECVNFTYDASLKERSTKDISWGGGGGG